VIRIDHVEMFVPDRRAAAKWYAGVLGLEVLEGYERWAEDPGGPLMISSDGGSTNFNDPYGHRLELTSYDHDETRSALERMKRQGREG